MFQRKLLRPFEFAIHHRDPFAARQSGVLLCVTGAKIAPAPHAAPYRSALFALCRRCTAHNLPLPPVCIFVVFLLTSSDLARRLWTYYSVVYPGRYPVFADLE